MSTPLGEVLRLPVKFIQGTSSAHPLIVQSIADTLTTKGKNILPVVVRLIDEDEYEATLNIQILDAARKAKLDFVWCIVTDAQSEAQVKTEAGLVLRLSIQEASEEALVGLFEYLQQNKVAFKTLKPQAVAKAIVQYRRSKTITQLKTLTTLKCGIGKAKLPALAEHLTV